jgi:tetratricopeptide (TPR) repeat protein
MGTWGAAIFADDMACDVRDGWRDLIADEVGAAEATDRILLDWQRTTADPDEGPVFWLALAAAQAATGSLQERVKQSALTIIDTGAGLARWQRQPKLLRRRQAVLAKLKAQLLGPQSAPTRVRPWKPPVASFNTGEAFSYLLDNGALALLRVYQVVREESGGTCAWLEILDFAGTAVPHALDVARLPGRLLARSNFFTQGYVLVEGPRTRLDPTHFEMLARGLPFCPPPPDHRPMKSYTWPKHLPGLLLRDAEEAARRGGPNERDRSLSAGDAPFFLERAREYRTRGMSHESIAGVDQALALDVRLSGTYYERGLPHLALGEYSHAADDCTAELRIPRAERSMVLLARALAKIKLGRREEALRDVAAVERLGSRSSGVQARLAEVLRELAGFRY